MCLDIINSWRSEFVIRLWDHQSIGEIMRMDENKKVVVQT